MIFTHSLFLYIWPHIIHSKCITYLKIDFTLLKLDHITHTGTILLVGSKSEQKHYIVVTSVSWFPTPRDVIAVTGAKSINETPWDA